MYNLLITTLIICIGTCYSSNSLLATPNYYNNDYSDYLPRYRTLNEGFSISKVEYKGAFMILFLNYIADDADKVALYGSKHADSWKIKTGNGSRLAAAYALLKTGDVRNIQVNKMLKAAHLQASGRKQFSMEKGDLLTFELYFDRLPNQVRIAHLVGGDKDEMGKGRINCQDLQIKSKDNTNLGTEEQMESSLKFFYRSKEAVNFPSAENDLLAEQKKPVEAIGEPMENPLEHSLKPINYMPKGLNNSEDLTCNERLVMSNVYFQDNKADFSGRVKAMHTISLVVDYLAYHSEAKIVLHGHTDIFGNAFKNLELSKKRVWTVKSTITARGIAAERIITVHHGGAQPLIQYKNGGDKNRRVEVEILCVDKEAPADTTSIE